MSIKRLESGPRMSKAVVHGDTVYLSGQTADDTSGSVAQQTSEVLAKVDRLLETVGSNKSKLLSVTIWLSDMAGFAEMNSVWDKWIDPANPPARATGESRLARPELKVEVMVVAAL